jgi:hypothetical protein
MKISVTKDISALRLAANALIDEAAAAERLQHVTQDKDGVYRAKTAEAVRYLAAGHPDDLSDFPFLRKEVGVTAPNASDLAEMWVERDRVLTQEIDPAIEGVTMTAKKSVALATNPAAIDAIVASLTFD